MRKGLAAVASAVLVAGMAAACGPAGPVRSAAEIAAESALAASISASGINPPTPKVLSVLGDSFGEGTGATSSNLGYAALVANHYGLVLDNDSQGGTGYIANLSGNKAYVPAVDRYQTVIAQHPSFVIVALGINDSSAKATNAQIMAAIHTVLAGLKAGLPMATIVVVGPFWPDGYPATSAVTVEAEVRAEAAADALPFIDPIAEHWVTGHRAGWNGPGSKATGEAAIFTGPDNTHPTDAGHANIAAHLEADLNKLKLGF